VELCFPCGNPETRRLKPLIQPEGIARVCILVA